MYSVLVKASTLGDINNYSSDELDDEVNSSLDEESTDEGEEQGDGSAFSAAGDDTTLSENKKIVVNEEEKRPLTRKERLVRHLRHSFKDLKKQLMMTLKCFVVTFLVITTLQISFPQTVHKVTPKQVFPVNSPIRDHYTGDLRSLANQFTFSELTFVMYYAPWDRESIQAIKPFMKAAKILKDQVVFAAINCWNPGSSCRNTHKLTRYPVLILHVNIGEKSKTLAPTVSRDNRALAYSGPYESEHFVRFINSAILPYKFIGNRRDFAALQLSHPAIALVFIANYNSEDDDLRFTANSHFTLLYKASIHWLEVDKRKECVWAVITDYGLARDLGLFGNETKESVTRNRAMPLIKLVMLDAMYVFNGTKYLNDPKPILQWITDLIPVARSPSWLEIPNGKSSLLSKSFDAGPALVVFSPDQPYEETNAIFDIARGIWISYNICSQNSSSVSRLSKASEFLVGAESRKSKLLSDETEMCSKADDFDEEDYLIYEPKAMESEESDCSDGHFTCHKLMPFFAKSGVTELVWNLVDGACQNLFGYNLPAGDFEPPCEKPRFDSSVNTSLANKNKNLMARERRSIKDRKIVEVYRWWKMENCRKNLLKKKSRKPAFDIKNVLPKILGRGCDNRTVSFSVIDSIEHFDLAEHWGINLGEDSTGAAIVDLQHEEHYTISSPINPLTLSNFVYNFSESLLDREYLSEQPQSEHLKDYAEEVYVESDTSKIYSSLRKISKVRKNLQVEENTPSKDKDFMKLQDFTSEKFLKVLSTKEKNVLVLFHRRSCAHCNTASTAMLNVASYFSANNTYHKLADTIVFARIDVSANTVPWNVNFQNLPAFVYYPRRGGANYQRGGGASSRMFDSRLPLTPDNLLRFVTSVLSSESKLEQAIDGCDLSCVQKVQKSLPARVASTNRELMRDSARLVRFQSSLKITKKEKQRKSVYKFLIDDEKRLKEGVVALRKKHQYLLKLQNSINSLDTSGIGKLVNNWKEVGKTW